MPRSPPGDPSPVELGEKLLDAANDQSIPRVLEQLNAGADVNYSGSIGETALMIVAHHLNLHLVMLLLAKGADKSIKSSSDGDFDGMNALEIARNYARFDPENRNIPLIIRLLSDDPPPPSGVPPPGGEPEGGAKTKKKKGSLSVRNKRRTTKKRARKTMKSRK